MADNKERIEVEISPSLDRTVYERQLKEFMAKTERLTWSKKPPGQAGLLETMLIPAGGRADLAMRRNLPAQFNIIKKSFETGLRDVTKNTAKLGTTGKDISKIGDSSKKAEGGIKGLARALKDATAQALKLTQSMGASIGKAGIGATRKAFGKGKIGRRALAGAGAFAAGNILGFVGSTYSEAMAAMQERDQARLAQGPYMMRMGGYDAKGATFGLPRKAWASGARLGYNQAQVAGIQGRAARLGFGTGPAAGKTAMELERGYGEGGIDIAAGLVRRTAGGQKGGASQAMKVMSQAMAVGIKTGLEDARIGEFLQAANDYAERQLEITPDKDSFKQYYRELATLQERGGPGLRGKYGAAALGRVDTAIKGGSGAQQALMYRAFGFGQGASYFDVLRKQEQGVGGKGNLKAIMEQLKKEYGEGEGGGLSQAGMVAFKNMGFGSTFMAEKMSKVYSEQQKGLIGEEDARKKIKGIEEKEAESKIPAIQRRAYSSVSKLAGILPTLAARFDRMAEAGEKLKPIMLEMDKLQKQMLEEFRKLIPAIIQLTKVISPLMGLARVIMNGFGFLIAGFRGMAKGWSEAKGLDKMGGAFSGMIQGFSEYEKSIKGQRPKETKTQVRDMETVDREKFKSLPTLKEKLKHFLFTPYNAAYNEEQKKLKEDAARKLKEQQAKQPKRATTSPQQAPVTPQAATPPAAPAKPAAPNPPQMQPVVPRATTTGTAQVIEGKQGGAPRKTGSAGSVKGG